MDRKDSEDCNELYSIADRMLSMGQYVTYADILKEFHAKRNEATCQKTSADEYSAVLKTWVNRQKREGLFEYKNGKDAKDGLRYKEDNRNNWFNHEMKKLSKVYYRDGKSLLLVDGLPLMDENTIACPIVQLESCNLKTIEGESVLNLVKLFFRFIIQRQVVSFDYNKGYSGEIQHVTIHPHLLKEYNNRWFICGYDENAQEEYKYGYYVKKYALDRICVTKKKIYPENGIAYKPTRPGFYKNYFREMVGVTRAKKGVEKQKVVIRSTDEYVHNLVLTKPFHSSQKETKQFDGTEGEFIIEVFPNTELKTKILSYGSGVYVSGDGPFETEIRESVRKMMKYYSLE